MKSSNGYLTSNRRIRYPFADDSDAPATVFGCFVDAVVQPFDPDAPEPYVSMVSSYGSTVMFTLAGAKSVVLTCTRAKTRFPVVSGRTDWCAYTFVLSSEGIAELAASSDSFAGTLRFAPRCICRSPEGVSSVLLYGGSRTWESGVRYTLDEALSEEPDAVVSGDVSLVPGYNMSLEATEDGITLAASPGAGAGVAPCGCDSSDDGGIAAWLSCENGHVRLFNDTCYDVEAYREDDGRGILKIHAKCVPCCTCGMYESIVNGRLVPLRDRISDAAASIGETYSTYEEYVAKWNERLAKALPEDIVVTMTAIPLDVAATELMGPIYGKMDRCGFSVSMRNDSFVDVTLSCAKIVSNGKLFQANLSYMDGDTPKVVPIEQNEGFTVVLKPGRSAVAGYFVRLDKMVQTDEQSGFVSSVEIEAKQGGTHVCTIRKALGV